MRNAKTRLVGKLKQKSAEFHHGVAVHASISLLLTAATTSLLVLSFF